MAARRKSNKEALAQIKVLVLDVLVRRLGEVAGACSTSSSPATYGDTEKTHIFPSCTLRLCMHHEAGVKCCFSEVEIMCENVDSNPAPLPWLYYPAGFITFDTSIHFTLFIFLHQGIQVKNDMVVVTTPRKQNRTCRAQEKSLGENNL